MYLLSWLMTKTFSTRRVPGSCSLRALNLKNLTYNLTSVSWVFSTEAFAYATRSSEVRRSPPLICRNPILWRQLAFLRYRWAQAHAYHGLYRFRYLSEGKRPGSQTWGSWFLGEWISHRVGCSLYRTPSLRLCCCPRKFILHKSFAELSEWSCKPSILRHWTKNHKRLGIWNATSSKTSGVRGYPEQGLLWSPSTYKPVPHPLQSPIDYRSPSHCWRGLSFQLSHSQAYCQITASHG